MERKPLQGQGGRLGAAESARVALALRLGPSTRAGAVLGVLHLGALGCLAVLPAPAVVLGGLGGIVVASLVGSLRLHAVREARDSVRGLTALADGCWRLELRGGRRAEARLLPSPFIHPSLVVLRLRDAHGPLRAVVVLPDMLDREAFRRLRAYLRVHA